MIRDYNTARQFREISLSKYTVEEKSSSVQTTTNDKKPMIPEPSRDRKRPQSSFIRFDTIRSHNRTISIVSLQGIPCENLVRKVQFNTHIHSEMHFRFHYRLVSFDTTKSYLMEHYTGCTFQPLWACFNTNYECLPQMCHYQLYRNYTSVTICVTYIPTAITLIIIKWVLTIIIQQRSASEFKFLAWKYKYKGPPT